MERGRAERGQDGHEDDPRGATVASPEPPGAHRRQGQEEPRRGVPEAAAPVDGGEARDRPAEIPEIAGREGHEVAGPEPLHVQRVVRRHGAPRPEHGAEHARRARQCRHHERPQAGAIAVQERRHGHRREDSGGDERRGVREPRRDDAGDAQAKRPPLSRAVLLDRESQDDQQERHGHVRRVWLRLRGIEDEWDSRRQESEGERRAEARRKHAPGDLPAERQRREAPEERDQAKRVLALSEDEDGELLEHEPARRGDLAIVERAQEARERALDDVQGHVRLVGPERRAGRVLPEPQCRAEGPQRHRDQPRRAADGSAGRTRRGA